MDPAARIIDFLYERLAIDDDWAVREPDGFTWWAGPAAQRVWAVPPRDVQGVAVSTVHIETDLLRGVPASEAAFERLAGINRLASLSAYVADTPTGRVALHASVSVTEDNWPLARVLALHTTALQVADAHAEAAALAEVFAGEVDRTAHPTHGFRETPDEMTGVASVYEARGAGESPFTATELAGLVHLDPSPWQTASSAIDGLEATLAFRPGAPPAQLVLDAAFRHPGLGSGLLMRLVLPVEPDAAVVQRLNAAERIQPDGHQLGGWAIDDAADAMVCSLFVPAGAYLPNLTRALIYHLAARSQWAAQLLFPSA